MDLKKILGSDDVFAMSDDNNPYNVKEYVSTDCYVLNALIGNGDIFGGLPIGKRVAFAGPSSTGKSLITAYVAKNYLKNKPNAKLIAFESEGSTFKEMMESINIDQDRVFISAVRTVEQFRSQITRLLNSIKEDQKKGKKDEYIILLDSLGNLGSQKENDDALSDNSKADFTRAKTIRSIFRIISLDLSLLEIPLLVVNHSYESMSLYSAPEMSGGQGVKYAADIVIMLTKAKAKEGTEHIGAILTLNINKSRFIPENIKGKVTVMFKKGIYKYSFLLELGLEFGLIKKEGISYVLGGIKKKKKEIIKNPESFFTEENLQSLRDIILSNWSFGGDEEISVEEFLIDQDDIESETSNN